MFRDPWVCLISLKRGVVCGRGGECFIDVKCDVGRDG